MRYITRAKRIRELMAAILGIIGIALSAIASSTQGIAAGRWNVFHSSTGFSVQYPSTWFPKGISKDRLVILSSKGGAEAVEIKQGQAIIVVMEERGYETLVELIDHDTQGAVVLSRTTIHNGSSG